MGPGLSKNGKQYNRRTLVATYANLKMNKIDIKSWQAAIDEFSGIDLAVRHKADDHRYDLQDEDGVSEVLISMGKLTEKDIRVRAGAHRCGRNRAGYWKTRSKTARDPS